MIVWGGGEGYGIHINCNEITGNGFGVYSERTSDVDAIHNWWGHATGPDGQGDSVSGNVDYRFWAQYVEGILIELDYSIEVGTDKFVGIDVFADDIFTKPHSKTYSMLAAQLLAAKLNVAQLSQFIPGYNSDCLFDIGDGESMTVIEAADEADIILRSGVDGHDYTDTVAKVDKDEVNDIKDVLDDFNNYGCEQVILCPCICY